MALEIAKLHVTVLLSCFFAENNDIPICYTTLNNDDSLMLWTASEPMVTSMLKVLDITFTNKMNS